MAATSDNQKKVAEGEDPLGVMYNAHAVIMEFSRLDEAKRKEGSEEVNAAFNTLISGAKKADHPGVRQLAASFIPTFFHVIPDDLIKNGWDAFLDLCEDEKPVIRQHAIKGAGVICENLPSKRESLCDILGQCLLSTDSNERSVLKRTFERVFKIDAGAVFTALMKHMVDGSDALKTTTTAYFSEQMKEHAKLIEKDPELQKKIAKGLKDILQDESKQVAGKQYTTLIRIIQRLKIFRQDKDLREELVKMIVQHTNLDIFDPADEEFSVKFAECASLLRPYAAAGGDVTNVLKFIFDQIVPNFEHIKADDRYKYLQKLVLLSPFASAQLAREHFPTVYKLLKESIPEKSEEEAKPPLSEIECYLHVFHTFAAKAPSIAKTECGIFIPSGQPSDFRPELTERKEEFQKRVEVLSDITKEFSANLRNELKKKSENKSPSKSSSSKDEKKTDDEEVEEIKKMKQSLRVMATINNLTKPLVKTRPEFRHDATHITPSWGKHPYKKKRSSSGGSQQVAKKSRGSTELYRAPGRGSFRSMSSSSSSGSGTKRKGGGGGGRGGGKRFRGGGGRGRRGRGRGRRGRGRGYRK